MKLGILISFLVANLFAQDPALILAESAKVYKSLKTSKIEFEQTLFFEVTGEEQKNSGIFVLGEGDAFKLETEQVLLVSDGVSLWEERKGSNQVVVKALLDMNTAYHPSQILFKYLECKALKAEKTSDGYHLVLDPKSKIRGLEELEVWLEKSSYQPTKIKTLDVTGNRSYYAIEQFVANPPLSDSDFEYKAGDGVEVIDMR